MSIPVRCPSCGVVLRVPDDLAGRSVRHPDCGGIFVVPRSPAAKPARTSAPAVRDDLDDLATEPEAPGSPWGTWLLTTCALLVAVGAVVWALTSRAQIESAQQQLVEGEEKARQAEVACEELKARLGKAERQSRALAATVVGLQEHAADAERKAQRTTAAELKLLQLTAEAERLKQLLAAAEKKADQVEELQRRLVAAEARAADLRKRLNGEKAAPATQGSGTGTTAKAAPRDAAKSKYEAFAGKWAGKGASIDLKPDGTGFGKFAFDQGNGLAMVTFTTISLYQKDDQTYLTLLIGNNTLAMRLTVSADRRQLVLEEESTRKDRLRITLNR
jgi:hypothetical protein